MPLYIACFQRCIQSVSDYTSLIILMIILMTNRSSFSTGENYLTVLFICMVAFLFRSMAHLKKCSNVHYDLLTFPLKYPVPIDLPHTCGDPESLVRGGPNLIAFF